MLSHERRKRIKDEEQNFKMVEYVFIFRYRSYSFINLSNCSVSCGILNLLTLFDG